jgi:hypothetical protein
MDVETRRRTCAACGAEIGPEASFCWRCFAPVAAAPATGVPPWTRFPPAPSTVAPAPASRSRAPWTSILVGALVVGLAVGVVVRVRSRAPAFPASVAGNARVDIPAMAEAIDAARASSNLPDDVELDVAIYGSAIQPRLMLMWARGDRLGDPEDLFGSGLAEASLGLPSGMPSPRSAARDGETFLCFDGRAMSPAAPAAICAWAEEGALWVLFDMQPGADLQATIDLAATASHEIG